MFNETEDVSSGNKVDSLKAVGNGSNIGNSNSSEYLNESRSLNG